MGTAMGADLQKMARRSGWLGPLSLSRAFRWARPLAVATLALLGLLTQPVLGESIDYSRFDHTATGFPLDGRHQDLKCEQCHLNGVFEGTQRQCSACHIQGNPRSAVFMPIKHIPLQSLASRAADCSTCHTTESFGGAHFAHSNVTPSSAVASSPGYGSCATCHNGVSSTGKPAQGHPLTNATGGGSQAPLGISCDECHTTASFKGSFTVYPTGHIPTSIACAACHSAGYSMALTQMVHTGISSGCTTCHSADAPGVAPLTFTMTFGTASGQPVTLKPTSQDYHPPTASSPSHFAISESCEVCHKIPATPMAATAAAGGFAGGVMSHAGITSGCARCHYNGSTPGDVTFLGTMAKGPPGTAWAVGAANHIPMGGAACEACHDPASTSTGGFKISASPQLSAAGHAAVSSVSCATCHSTGAAFYGVTGLQTQASNHIPIAGANCTASGCHAQNFAAGGFVISGTPGSTPVLSVAGHAVVASVACDTCHDNIAANLTFQGQNLGPKIYLRPGAAAAGLSKADAAHATGNLATQDCGQCHSTAPPFAGGTLAANHIPLPSPQPACATCHAAGYGVGLSIMVHSVVKSETCTTCHGAGKGPFSGSSQGVGGQPKEPPGTLGAPGAGNHIPVGTADCVACHASADAMSGTGFVTSTTPALSVAGHAAVSGITCASCHYAAGTTTGSVPWYGVAATVAPPGAVGTSGAANHIALGSGDCVTCHGGTIAIGAFKISATPSLGTAGHQAVSSVSCASCHGTGAAWYGVPTLATQLASHFPIGAASCNGSGCHGSNFATGGFHISGTPGGASAPLTAAGHANVASLACTSCHETNAADLTFQGVLGQIYLRPNAGTPSAGLSTVDAAHATGTLATQDCGQCHNTTGPFTGNQLATNHFPLPTPQPACADCHAAGYGVGKSIMKHSDVASEACVLCHGPGKGPFAGTSQGAGGQPKQPPGTVGTSGSTNHVPIGSADCGPACHKTASDVMNGTGFVMGTMMGNSAAHGAVSSLSCTACHSAGMAWFGVTALKTPPGTPATFPCGAACSPSAANHIPVVTTDACTVCHASATTYTTFAGGSMNHAGISSGCASCHATGNVWYGVTNLVTQLATHIAFNSGVDCVTCHGQNFATGGFVIASSPVLTAANHANVSTTCNSCHENNAKDLAYQGVTTRIYVRPGALAVGLSPIDLAHAVGNLLTQDCSACHTTTPPFTGNTEPSNHIPTGTGANCAANCHKAGFAAATTVMDHADPSVSGTACVTCHGKGKGPFYGTAQSQAGGQPMQPPGTVGVSGATNHIPMGTGSLTCNTGCHTATPPATAVSGGFSFAMKGNTAAHQVVVSGANCDTCHESGLAWYLDATGGKIRVRPNGHHTGTDCGSPNGCHAGQYNGFNAGAAAAAARATKAKATSGLTRRPIPGATGPVTQPTLKLAGSGPYSHLGIPPGSCKDCHSPGGSASAMPGGHLLTLLSCDACHMTTAWTPARYAHTGVGPNQCVTCHAGPKTWATPKPAAHFVTNRSCDKCHHSTRNWLPVMYDHLSPRYRPQPGILACIGCHLTNTEMIVPGLSKPAGRKALPGGPVRNQ